LQSIEDGEDAQARPAGLLYWQRALREQQMGTTASQMARTLA
jgi:hypothetical protein